MRVLSPWERNAEAVGGLSHLSFPLSMMRPENGPKKDLH